MSILDDKNLWDTVFPSSKTGGPRKTYPPFWTPQIGESLTGQIVRITSSAKTGKNYYQLATESENGTSGRLLTLPAVTAVYSAIGNANEEYEGDVGVGSIVFIKYHGRKVSKKGYEYRNFEVFISSREVAKKIMEDKGIKGWEGEISDDDVKRAEAAREEWKKRTGQDAGDREEKKDEKDEEKEIPKEEKEKKTKKPKKKEKQEELDSAEARIQTVKDEIEKMCVAFPRFPVATVERILKSTGVDMEAEMFLEGMGIKVEDGNALRPE